MRIQISAIWRLKPGPERELASHYVTRAGASGRSLGLTSIAIVEHAESAAMNERLRREERPDLVEGLDVGDRIGAG